MAGFSGTDDGITLRAKEIQRNDLRRKHKNALANGLLVNHVALFKKRCNNNKPFTYYYLNLILIKKQHIAEGVEKCINNIPKALRSFQIKAIKDVFN